LKRGDLVKVKAALEARDSRGAAAFLEKDGHGLQAAQVNTELAAPEATLHCQTMTPKDESMRKSGEMGPCSLTLTAIARQ